MTNKDNLASVNRGGDGKEKNFWSYCCNNIIGIYLPFYKSMTKLTYVEITEYNTKALTYIELNEPGQELVQDFVAPYDILHGISIQIGTFARDNNSMWQFEIREKNTGEVIYQDDFNASLIVDSAYELMKFERRIKVDKGNQYQFVIRAIDVKKLSSLAFYTSETSVIANSDLTHDGKVIDADMCFKVYGGDYDVWWTSYLLLLFLLVAFYFARLYYLLAREGDCKADSVLQAMTVGIIAFLLMFTFSHTVHFSDESDNMFGGMVIAKGGVLYKDYVTQHTPVTYYLCSIFALLGAGSVEQFRLSYYLLVAVLWGLLYLRHYEYFGIKNMMLLPVLEVIGVYSVVWPYGAQILSDGIQGFLAVVLLLEFVRYYKDRELGWKRSIIVSAAVWGSFGAAFISVYALVWVVLIVLILETIYCINRKYYWKKIVNRYSIFLISMSVPLLAAVVYFKFNNSLGRAFHQFYTFNREVYPKYKYIEGLGENIVQPFVNGIQNFFGIIADNFNAIITATASNIIVLQFLIMVSAVVVLVLLFTRKKYVESFSVFFVMCFSATRGYGFHGMAAWYVAIMIIAVHIDIYIGYLSKFGKPLLGIMSIIFLNTYVSLVCSNLLFEQISVSDMESTVISMTEEDSDKSIYLDAWTSSSLYYFYKGRYPVNCAVFMLPWYMDWYESDNIAALNVEKPRIVIYNEEANVWGYSYYSLAFSEELKKNYTRLSENPDGGWQYSVWTRN